MMNEMTAEEARTYFIKCNENLISVAKDENMYSYERQEIEAVCSRRAFEANKLAIKALEAQSQTIVMTKEEFERYLANEDLVVVKRKFLNEALESQPCEDAVSREAVKELVVKEFVNPQDGMEEWRNAVNDVVEEILHAVETMPSVIPQRKMGRWIDFNWNDGDICRWGIKCSECHTEYKHGGEMWHNPKFCPNCGAEISGGGEDETSD